MDLNELTAEISAKRKEIKELILREARNLKLQEVVQEIDFTPESMEYADFREGQMLDTKCCQGRNTVSISPKKLVLSNGDIEIARFEGEEVEAHYRKMSDCINAIKQRGGYDLPF